MLCAFAAPVAALVSGEWPVAAVGALTLAMAMVSYRAVLRYYGLPLAWVLVLPGAGCLFLGMTWSSAIRYWRGRRSLWKGRQYGTDEAAAGALEDTPR
jgi:hypothetical protein